MKFKTIYIAGINRSGGSLLARLFDNHSSILSYPTELGFPSDNSFYEIIDSYAGIPQSIPNYDSNKKTDLYKLLEIPTTKPTYSTRWGKEKSDPLGVRDNYLEKNFYGNIKTSFDYNKFTTSFNQLVKIASKVLGGKGGGGRKDFAQAGGTDKNKIEEAFKTLSKKIN